MKHFENNIRPHKTYHKNDFFCPRCWIFEPMIHFGFGHAAMATLKNKVWEGAFSGRLKNCNVRSLFDFMGADPK